LKKSEEFFAIRPKLKSKKYKKNLTQIPEEAVNTTGLNKTEVSGVNQPIVNLVNLKLQWRKYS
jgi:hypothetical protein